MGLFSKKNQEPIFLKEESDAVRELEVLKALESKLNAEGKTLIEKHIKSIEAGIAGEQRIAYELKNSHMPLVVLHDVYLEDGDLSAQIDYLVFTEKLCFIIESKNLYGDMEIDKDGNFIRKIHYGKQYKKERIYSPVTQNERHFQLIRKVLLDRQSFLTRLIAPKIIDSTFRPIIVLANPKAVLNMKDAPDTVTKQVIYVDQLISYMKEANKASKLESSSFENTTDWANNFLNLHKSVEKDYTKIYQTYLLNNTEQECGIVATPNNQIIESQDSSDTEEISDDLKKRLMETKVYAALKEWRLQQSRIERIKPYYIFNDAQLLNLLMKNPKSKDDLLKVTGFGPVKVEKYGTQIMEVLDQYRK